MSSAAANSPIERGSRASRRIARARPKLIPSASETARRRMLSSTRSDISIQASRGSLTSTSASGIERRRRPVPPTR